MNCFGLLGERLTHSYSPMIHAEFGDYEYELYEKKPEEVEDFLLNGDFNGLNVTIPYKKTVVPFCAELSETARAIGSVNTITRLPDGSLYGDNTDYYGFAYLLRKAAADSSGEKVIVLGGGGSSLTARAVLNDADAGEIVVISRTGADNYENIEKHLDATMIINTTPVGMYPENGASPISDLADFKNCRAVIDMIYNPLRTELLLRAEELGIPCAGGLAMLVAQAKQSAEFFTCASIPEEQISTIVSSIERQTRNVILIGMPGCGKTSVGAALAEMTGRAFFDTDAFIAEAAGRSVRDILANDGEEIFRRLESDALRALCKRSGLVIATGGGVVTRPENKNIIRQNGTVVFLERAVAELTTSGRPLSEAAGIGALAAVRLPVYPKWSDHTVKVRGVGQTASDIFELITGDA